MQFVYLIINSSLDAIHIAEMTAERRHVGEKKLEVLFAVRLLRALSIVRSTIRCKHRGWCIRWHNLIAQKRMEKPVVVHDVDAVAFGNAEPVLGSKTRYLCTCIRVKKNAIQELHLKQIRGKQQQIRGRRCYAKSSAAVGPDGDASDAVVEGLSPYRECRMAGPH